MNKRSGKPFRGGVAASMLFALLGTALLLSLSLL